ncbi:hypothetical protein BKA58DRAFT_454988 [Alternaria rosae]|uniref:uncharacterized protein n=1 Tax=Alternaria rosae TaxID=1187941 RepID=UPI001E8D0DA6|nr:uncharacterized protein BKA58DRAFT_454988 [Alternaria rosae]KAH6875908.1 hypothetical protein BKA58DRAFT_454988 [Alternaria rosae]
MTLSFEVKRGKLQSLDQDQTTTTCSEPASAAAPTIATTTPKTLLEPHESRPGDSTELQAYDVNAKDRKNKASKAAQDPIFAIVEAGDTKTRYHVHRWLLVQNSEYFKKALSGLWKEAQDGVVTLEDVECSTCEWTTFGGMHDLLDETTVSIFVDWVYTQRLPQTELEWCNGKHEDHRLRMKSNAQLVRTKAFILEDQIMSPLFYRTVRDSLIEHIVERGAYYGALIHAFAHLPKAHAILDFFVEVQCRGFDDSYDTAGNGELEL